MRRSFYKRKNIPTKTIRWTVPTQVAVDVQAWSRTIGIHEGELAAAAIIEYMQKYYHRWNEESAYIQLPQPASMKGNYTGISLKDILGELEKSNGRRH